MIYMFDKFIKGIKKSFDGKTYIRKLYKCNLCGKDSYMHTCLQCEIDDAYRGFNN